MLGKHVGNTGVAVLESLSHRETGESQVYRPEYCDDVRLMAQDGAFPEQWCAAIGVSARTLNGWADRVPELAAAIDTAWQILAAVYSKRLKEAQSAVELRKLIFICEKRFPNVWGQNAQFDEMHFKQPARNSDGPNSVSSSNEKRAARIEELIAKRAQP